MSVRIAINGFGRIGRNVLRAIHESVCVAVEAAAPFGWERYVRRTRHGHRHDELRRLGAGQGPVRPLRHHRRGRRRRRQRAALVLVPSIYSIVPPNDGSALRHGHHFEPVDFVIDHGRGHHDAYSAGSCQRTYARACGCRQRPRRHREELIESERGWSGREAFVTMMQTADLGQGNDRSGPGRLNGSSIRCVLAERQVGP